MKRAFRAVGRSFQKVFAFLFKPFLKIPAVRRRYLRRMLEYIEDTPRAKLPEELRPVQAALKRMPTRQQKLAALESGFEAQASGEAPPQSRAIRRAAAKQARRRY
jgi:hypothetical protein